jgi:hypothetical protein
VIAPICYSLYSVFVERLIHVKYIAATSWILFLRSKYSITCNRQNAAKEPFKLKGVLRMATLRCSSFRDLTPRRLLSSAQIASAVCLWSESHKATKGRNEISCQSRSLGSICDSHKSSIGSWNHSYCLSKNTYIALSPLRTQTATMAANPLFAIAWLSKVRKLREAPFANHFTAGSYLNMRAGSDLHILRRSAACKTSAGGVESILSGENQ